MTWERWTPDTKFEMSERYLVQYVSIGGDQIKYDVLRCAGNVDHPVFIIGNHFSWDICSEILNVCKIILPDEIL